VDLASRLAESLKRMRSEAGLTHAQMAKTLGISRPSLTRLENAEQNVTLRTLSQICRALHCDPGDLFKPGQLRAPRHPRRSI
jgi:DNA-binding Xre family transcriptional regulator